MGGTPPIVLIPGLLSSPRLYGEQIPELWRIGPVMVADNTRDDSTAAIARRVLAAAPRRFALVGLSMGGYIAFEMMRQAPERIVRLALLSTAATPDTAEQSERRRDQIALAESGRFGEIADLLFPRLVHPSRHDDDALREVVRLMARETGPAAFVRQQTANITRPDSRPDLASIQCPTLVLVGDGDEITPPARAAEIARGIAEAQHAVVRDCDHLSSLERPAQVTRALVEWLRDASEPAAPPRPGGDGMAIV